MQLVVRICAARGEQIRAATRREEVEGRRRVHALEAEDEARDAAAAKREAKKRETQRRQEVPNFNDSP